MFHTFLQSVTEISKEFGTRPWFILMVGRRYLEKRGFYGKIMLLSSFFICPRGCQWSSLIPFLLLITWALAFIKKKS